MKGILQNLLLMLVTAALALVTVELTFRLLGHAPQRVAAGGEKQPLERLVVFDPVLQTRYRPDVSVAVNSQYGEFSTTYRTNSLGLRDRALDVDQSARRILVLGNSLVEGWGVEEDAGLVRVAERQLLQNTGKYLRLVNGGMSGFGVAQSFLLAQELITKTKPSTIVFVYLSTMVRADHAFLQIADRSADGLATGLSADALLKQPTPQEPKAMPSAWLQSLRIHSSTAQFAAQRLDNRAAQDGIKPGDPNTDLLAGLRAPAERLALLHEPSLKHLRGLAALGKAENIPLIVVHLPMPHQVSNREWSLGRLAYRLENKIYPADDAEIVANLCKAYDLNCISAHTYLKAALQSPEKQQQYYYSYDFHPNAAGYELIGKWIADQLR